MPTENEGYDFEIPEQISSGPSYEQIEAAFTEGNQATLTSWMGTHFPELVDYMDYMEAPDFSGVEFAKAKNFQTQRELASQYRQGMTGLSDQFTKGMGDIRSAVGKSGFASHGGLETMEKSMMDRVGTDAGRMFSDYGRKSAAATDDFVMATHQAQQDAMGEFYDNVAQLMQYDIADTPADDSSAFWDLDPSNDGLFCVVSSALHDTGSWTASQKKKAVDWCQETHHDGSERGKTWVKGYHTWGEFLAKWTKKSKAVKWVVNTTTTAFVDHAKDNKPNYLGWMIHNLWINPLSYIIGYSKKNKVTGKIATASMIGLYTALFPLFALISIPHVLKMKRTKKNG